MPIADYTNVPAVSEALKGTDVIITTLGYAAQPLQVPIAEAAKTAGVRLFVPSEFGTSDVGAKDGALAMKAQLAEKIRSIIPVAQFFTGNFADWMWLPDLFLDPKSGKVAVGGDGNAKMSFTSRPDIARFVVHVLTALAPEESLNKAFRIEAERLVCPTLLVSPDNEADTVVQSFNEIFKAYEEKHGTKLEVKYIPLEELGQNLAKNPYDIASLLHVGWASGFGTVGDSSSLDNEKYPGWNPTPVIDYL